MQESYSVPYHNDEGYVSVDTDVGEWEPQPEVQREEKTAERPNYQDLPTEVLSWLDILTMLLYDKSDSLTSRTENLLKSLKSTGIIIPNAADVRDYLTNHPNIDDLLRPVCARALEVFGETAQLSIEVYRDPETKGEYLAVYVRQKKYQKDIMNRIKTVWSAYKNSPDRKLGRLFVTTDFRPPLRHVSI